MANVTESHHLEHVNASPNLPDPPEPRDPPDAPNRQPVNRRQDDNVLQHAKRWNPKYPTFKLRQRRLTTFRNWPQEHFLNHKTLADAGFVYEGHDDTVRCFNCGGTISNWMPGEDIWVEHAWLFPKCSFIIHKTNKDFVETVHSLGTDMRRPTLAQVCAKMKENGMDPVGVTYPLEKDAAVQLLVKLGLEQTIVLNVAEKIKEDGESISSDMLLRKVRQVQGHVEDTEEDIADNVEEVHTLKTDNTEMRSRMNCKMCLDKEITHVFLPCGHFVSCTDCSLAVENCPVCRTPIGGVVRAFIC